MKGLRREKTKNTLPTADELSTRPHSRAIFVKPELDFAAAVEKGKRIKENIRKKYEESFALERTEEEARFAREVLTASTTTPAASRRGAVSLKEGSSLVDGHIAVEPFTADDSFVPVNPRIGVFPIADTKCFPHRRKSTGWEVGLRNYQKKDVVDASIRPFSTVEAIQPPIVEKVVEVAPPVVTKAPVVLEERKPSNSGIQRQESLRTKLKSSNRTTVEPIHEPSMEEQQKYFGEQAKLKFQATYHQLSSQADSLLGGFDTLHEVVKATEMNNVLVVAYNALEQEGVLTPREMRRARTAEARPTIKRGPKSAMKPSERLKPLNLTPLHIDVPADAPMTPPDAPNSVSSGHSVQSVQWNDVVDSQPTDIESSLHQRRTKASERLDDHSYDDISGELSYNLGSPRAIFLSGCLKHSLPPRAQVILRKRTSSTINLSHMGIGNQMAMVLAESLHDLPYLQVLNLCDNNLEDSGLSALLRSIKKHPTIEILDISQNIIDSEAAAALADLIGNPDCRLRCLRMSDANIDDSECARFVQVLMHNRHLQELDMSKNLLGKDENLNAVQPDFETGGESLAELIRVGTCPLQTLNLHWNMIRLEGAEVLCDSIRYNQHLINLDLSYNALGRSAASVLGATLFENRTLQTINVANNGIDAVGSFALFVGLRENQVVRSVVVDGNPIGEQGARMLMKLAASEGHRLEVSAKNCDFAVRSADVRLSIDGEPFPSNT